MTRQGKRLAAGGTADLYEWHDGHVLKLFRERADYHQNEIRATRVAHRLGLPVPVVEPDLVEVDGRQGIVMERVDGLTLTEYVNTHADGVADYARAMAELHAAIHDHLVPELLSYRQNVLKWAIDQVDELEPKAKATILQVLDMLPVGDTMCHGDFHPSNIIISGHSLVVIDWLVGTRGHALADFANTSLLAMAWPSFFPEEQYKRVQTRWELFWNTYQARYRDLCPYSDEELKGWQLVVAAASLFLGAKPAPKPLWLAFINATLQSEIC